MITIRSFLPLAWFADISLLRMLCYDFPNGAKNEFKNIAVY